MLILGLDPGATTGWCVWDSEERRVLGAGTFPEDEVEVDQGLLSECADCVVIERPRGYGPTFPQVVECGIAFGGIRAIFREHYGRSSVHELGRREIREALTAAMHGTVRVRNDATAWAAVLELHGGPSAARKGGPLYGLRGTGSHGRAALAAAVAWDLVQVRA